MGARQLGGTVVEVTRQQKEKLLDKEIHVALNAPKPAKKTKAPKTRKTRTRPFARDARRAIATAILEEVPLTYAARSAVDTARETSDDTKHNAALRTLKAGLPATLWIGYEPPSAAMHLPAGMTQGRGMAMQVEPIWSDADPDGEDPGHWMQIARDEIARILVDDA